MAARQSVRLLARQITSQCSQPPPLARRTFSSISPCLSAHNFAMPAMSPTMTEGNISSWRVKEGDSFSAGDVLLEIETDKATMDVEAQDDGVMVKIFAENGTKSVKVGARIAVFGDPGDDVSSLEIPPDDSKPVQPEPKAESTPPKETKTTPETKKPAKDQPKITPTGPGQNPKYPLYPSVIALIHENHIPDQDVAKITATGPNGRLLKGDVLAYLGAIKSDYSAQQSKRIEHMAHLDLSNVKVMPTAPKPTAAPTAAPPAEVPIPKLSSISLTVSLAEVLKVQKRIEDTLGVTVPLSTFLARAVDLANDDLPKPEDTKPSADDLFNAVLGLNSIPTTSRGTYLPQIDALPHPTPRKALSRSKPSISRKPDIIDILSGKAIPKRSSSSSSRVAGRNLTTADGAINVFSLTVPAGEEQRARTFLERVKTVLQVEPGKLIL
ncbi:uncharacterized protein Z518_01711 [Rhinocladiella mackenziei CBS 650.93]|uniref:Pyruvate dehydrogenase protein x component n=1 Tax=Rhinocladiella mackenziei CBS 650.93 TaxID=1442369 RepID=A0A0D2G6N7_9EURO|nr:uncharacterized protein Z518_01711 [Rhinocladiella mackenziei CBS 650.93]KIX10627.1 hypothetical protein Z518_01711 [Rhinocladiella mackenziei CBS 650.93]